MKPEQTKVLDPAQTGLSVHRVPFPQSILSFSPQFSVLSSGPPRIHLDLLVVLTFDS